MRFSLSFPQTARKASLCYKKHYKFWKKAKKKHLVFQAKCLIFIWRPPRGFRTPVAGRERPLAEIEQEQEIITNSIHYRNLSPNA